MNHVMKLSLRTSSLRPDTGTPLIERAGRLPNVISLGRGDPDLPAPPHVVDAARQALAEGATHYSPIRGLDALREAIAVKLRRENQIEADPDREVLITTGSQEAVVVTLLALLDPGDEILLPNPHYFAYENAVHYVGGRVIPIPTYAQDEFQPQAEVIARCITPRTKAIALVTPNNPTGAMYSREVLESIGELAVQRGLYIISDELYEKLVFDAEHFSIASREDFRERTVTINGFSKSFQMTGFRVGYLTGPAPFVEAAHLIKRTLTICAPTASQHAAIAALTGPQESMVAAHATYVERRNACFDRLETLGVPFFHPPGTFYIFLDVSKSNTSSLEVCQRLLSDAAVLAYPGSTFGEQGEGYIRISLLADTPRLLEGLDRIAEFLGQLS